MKPRSTVGRTFKLAGIALAIGLTAASCSKSDSTETTAAAATETEVAAETTAAAATAETTAAVAAAETTAAAAAAPAGEGGEITVAIVDNPTPTFDRGPQITGAVEREHRYPGALVDHMGREHD